MQLSKKKKSFKNKYGVHSCKQPLIYYLAEMWFPAHKKDLKVLHDIEKKSLGHLA